MGEGDKRPSGRTVRYDARDLARHAKKHVLTEAEWDEKVAGGPAGARSADDAALIARTATLDDPLTTSLLAEVARRSMTIEVSPAQLDEARALDPDDGERPSDHASERASQPTKDPG